MKRIFLLLAFVLAGVFYSCEEYDDSAILDRLSGVEARVKQLEEMCKQMNTNISSLQTIVSAIQKNDQISSIAPITKNGEEIGYTIVFTSGKIITIYHGADGQAPIVGVKKHTDGVYYWTINGEWMTDESGNRIRANAIDGEDGADGITPQLKIENGYWCISYDGGATWNQLAKATGEDGDSFFQSVTQDDECVYFTLSDGTVLTVDKKKELTINFDMSSLAEISTNSDVTIPYTVVSSAEIVEVEVIPIADLSATVVSSDSSKKTGHILIHTGIQTNVKVLVFVSDGDKVVMKSIVLQVIPRFKHNSLAIMFGGTDCGYDPYMLESLKNLTSDATYKDKFSWVEIHSFNPHSDPAAPCLDIDQMELPYAFGISGYPTVLVDNCIRVENRASVTANLANLKLAIDSSFENSAAVGISATMALDEDNRVVTARVRVQAKVQNVYRVSMWLLEDNIKGGQAGSSTITSHDNAVRYVARDADNNVDYFGYELNDGKEMIPNQISERMFSIQVTNSFVKLANCKLLFFVTTADGDSYKIVNSVVSKDLLAEIPFEYI